MADTRTPAQLARYRARRRRQFWDRWLPLWLVVPLGMVLLLFSLPITLPVVAALLHRDKRRLAAAVAHTDCAACGTRLGRAALDRAEAMRAERMAAFRDACAGGIPRVPKSADAVCAWCGAEYDFNAGRRVFSLRPQRSPAIAGTGADSHVDP